jgi:hypothetical protein
MNSDTQHHTFPEAKSNSTSSPEARDSKASELASLLAEAKAIGERGRAAMARRAAGLNPRIPIEQ